MQETMLAAYLPGNSTVEMRTVPVPRPGYGEVLLRMKASTICGSDIRCIYHEHLGKGPEGYQGMIAGHEPCGQIVEAGPGCRRFGVDDRVIVYHISGCGVCTAWKRSGAIRSGRHKRSRTLPWNRRRRRGRTRSSGVSSRAPTAQLAPVRSLPGSIPAAPSCR